MCLCVRSLSSQSLPVCALHRQICLSWSSVSALWSRGQGWLWSGTSLEEEGLEEEGRRKAGGSEMWWRSAVVAWANDSVLGHGEGAHPRAAAPPTSNMPYYVDLWRGLDSTFN